MDLKGLNEIQKEAVLNIDGPCMINAGAGSGKTRIITYKVAYLLDRGVDPLSIMALTFTNKAAKEMKNRIAVLAGNKNIYLLKMGTFHSVFSRILKNYSEYIGFPHTFTIYDASDTRNAIKQCIKELYLDDKIYKPADVASRISFLKNHLVDASSYGDMDDLRQQDRWMKRERICDIYSLYSKKCKNEGIMDFDDLLLYMNKLLKNNATVAEELAGSIRYILVDEYQDTNLAQYHILKMLSSKNRNITVVGDDSQSIYGFRGARIQNILNFKQDYPDMKEFRLERNYRSTQTIVNASNSVIFHNSNRLKKECFSEEEIGMEIEIMSAYSDIDEAASVVSHILKTKYSTKTPYSSFAILYRTNAQSRQLEEALRRRNIPYKIYAGHSFYERKEIKDVLAYMRLILNPNDNEAFRRAVTFPSRGIGNVTIEKLQHISANENISFLAAARKENLGEWEIKGASASKLQSFVSLIDELSSKIEVENALEVVKSLLQRAGIIASLEADQSPEGISRKENVMELLNGINEFIQEETETAVENDTEVRFPSLELYLEKVALLTDADEQENKNNDEVKLMTLHSSKGLEFPYIYITGMEENLFPSILSKVNPDKLEEERRLFYVGMTRAEKRLTLSYANSRLHNGKTEYSYPSRFLKEIDRQYVKAPSKLYEEQELPPRVSLDFQTSTQNFKKLSSVFHNKMFKGGEMTAGKLSVSGLTSKQSSAGEFSKEEFSAGDKVMHNKFGVGEVISVSGNGTEKKAVVDFKNVGTKTLLLKYAKLQKI